MTDAPLQPGGAMDQAPRTLPSILSGAGCDTRLLGMLLALGVIWIGFHLLSEATS